MAEGGSSAAAADEVQRVWYNDAHTLFLKNVDWSAKDQDLTNLFTPFGDLKSVRIVRDAETGRSRVGGCLAAWVGGWVGAYREGCRDWRVTGVSLPGGWVRIVRGAETGRSRVCR